METPDGDASGYFIVTPSIKSVAIKACRHFMIPVARFMLNIGVSYNEFAEISKLAFVQVASDEYGIRGRKTNMSRVSVMTGLNRKEVRKIRDRLEGEDWTLDPGLSKPASVLTTWFTDTAYLGRRGAPVWLPYEADEGKRSFTSLVREVGGDVPPGAMLRELRRAGCVKEMRPGVWKAVKRQYSPAGVDLFQVQRFGECLHDLANTMGRNYLESSVQSERLFEFRAWADNVNMNSARPIKDYIARLGRGYLESVDDLLAKNLIDHRSLDSETTMRCGVGVYYFDSGVNPK